MRLIFDAPPGRKSIANVDSITVRPAAGRPATGAKPAAALPPATRPVVKAPAADNIFDDTVPADAKRRPYKGLAARIPGTIQAEDYDEGGEGVAYHDTTPFNDGRTIPHYREDGVETKAAVEASGNTAHVGAMAGEWIEYTVDVTADGEYDIDLRVAHPAGGNTILVQINGAEPGWSVRVPKTQTWLDWQTASVSGAKMAKGRGVLRITFQAREPVSVANIDSITIRASTPPRRP
jgi:hypothetical protein